MVKGPELRTREHVPFVDLGAIHEGLRDEILDAVSELIDSGAFTNGPPVADFESAFATYCRARYCVGVGSGLDALRLGLLASGVEPGSEVVVPAMTFVATFEAVTQVGAVPVPADISERDDCLDPLAAEAALTPRTRAVLPVHLYGQMADMGAFGKLGARAGVDVLEDACQAHGAVRDGLRPAAAASAAAFSFYPGKNLGAFGDAGALVTNDCSIAHRVRTLREHGQTAKYRHEVPGYTARLDTLQAVVLLRKLVLLEPWNAARRAAVELYRQALDGIGDLVLPPVAPASVPVWHLFAVRTANPDRLAAFLGTMGIQTGRHYPEPPHLSGAYAPLGYGRGAFPIAERLARETLSLPLFPGITESQLELVSDSVRRFFSDA